MSRNLAAAAGRPYRRAAVATAAALGAVFLAAREPVMTVTGGAAAGAALLLLGVAALAGGALGHRRGARRTHRAGVSAGRLARAQGSAYLVWFAGHALTWAGGLVLWHTAVLRVFGPRRAVLALGAGCVAAAVFSLAGLAGRAPLAMLGLCWKHLAPSPSTPAASYPESAVALAWRFRDAVELDAATARRHRRLSVFTRIQIALDLAATGRSGPRVDLGRPLGAALLHEAGCRARALALIASPAMLLALLLSLAGLLETPAAFDPALWATAAPGAGAGQGEPLREPAERAAPAAASEVAAAGEAAGKDGQPTRGDQGRASSPGEASDSGVAAADAEGSVSTPDGSAADPASAESAATDGAEPSGPSGEESSSGEESPSGEGPPSGEDPSVGEDPSSGEPAAGQAGAASAAAGESSPDEGSEGGDKGRGAGETRSSGGGTEDGDDDAWGLGSGAPVGEPAALRPPSQGEILTLRLPGLGSRNVPMDDGDLAPPEAAAAPGAADPRPLVAPPRRPEAQPLPQQPLPAWIVRLLAGTPREER